MLKITNTHKGPRGVNAVIGPVLLDPDQTIEVEVYVREQEHIEASGWFEISGEYKANPGLTERPSMNDDIFANKDAEIAELRKQLAAKSGGDSERDDLKKQADELGVEYAKNIPTEKLKELVDAKLAE
ncbi:hypothetical protein ACVINZ_006193 [Mesorhizobium jarvisii]